MWLINCLRLDHNTISNFRKDNPKAIKKVFRITVQIAKHIDLIGGTLFAGDSTKFRGTPDLNVRSGEPADNGTKPDHVKHARHTLNVPDQKMGVSSQDKIGSLSAMIFWTLDLDLNFLRLPETA